MASGGNGTPAHVAAELFKMMTGIDIVHVPYRGAAPALTDLLGGQAQLMFPTVSGSIEYVRAGKLRALAVTTASRWEGLPDLPTMGEFVPGYEASSWYGIGAPKHKSESRNGSTGTSGTVPTSLAYQMRQSNAYVRANA